MKRPTIALCMIMKNEEKNLPRLLESVKDCFDEIHITDTGSTDNSVELAKSLGASVHSFVWVDDFAKARNYSFSHATTDYVMWLDLDDVLVNKDNFIKWRDHAMGLNDYWVATYDYASDHLGNPVISFARERVVRRNGGAEWKYFVHEGLIPPPNVRGQYATTWKVKHMRTTEDLKKDKGRNLRLFEKNKDQIDNRMRFYYGKELFESGRPMEAFAPLMEAVSDPDLQLHDRILGIQYAAFALMSCHQWDKAIQVAHQGLQLSPNKAEFHNVIGDCLLQKNKRAEAIPFFEAAKHCKNVMPGDRYAGAEFNYKEQYTSYPRNKIAQIMLSFGDFEKARDIAKETLELYPNQESKNLLDSALDYLNKTKVPDAVVVETDEIVISTPPVGAYDWDEEIAKTKGMGGSETAAIEMSKHLHKLTGKPVKIFNPRKAKLVAESGVEYWPADELPKYFSQYKPKVHIAWRHNIKVTDARTFVWCHDLVTQNGESSQYYEKMICLSPFHKNYVQAMQGVPEDKILLSRNGIDPSRFTETIEKNPNKIIFPSSPDRGLDRAMMIVEKAREKHPDLELHVFYGFDNLRKYGMAEMVDRLEAMIKVRPWVKYHGFTEQKALAKHMQESVVWLYPANFIESFCITAIEALASGCYPLVRDIGALPDTLSEAVKDNMATLLDCDAVGEADVSHWAASLSNVLEEKAWERVKVNPESYSWESVAKEWCEWIVSSS